MLLSRLLLARLLPALLLIVPRLRGALTVCLLPLPHPLVERREAAHEIARAIQGLPFSSAFARSGARRRTFEGLRSRIQIGRDLALERPGLLRVAAPDQPT